MRSCILPALLCCSRRICVPGSYTAGVSPCWQERLVGAKNENIIYVILWGIYICILQIHLISKQFFFLLKPTYILCSLNLTWSSSKLVTWREQKCLGQRHPSQSQLPGPFSEPRHGTEDPSTRPVFCCPCWYWLFALCCDWL